jgi:hypothetical protein
VRGRRGVRLENVWVVEMDQEVGRPHDTHPFPAGSVKKVLVSGDDNRTVVSGTDHELVVIWVGCDGI